MPPQSTQTLPREITFNALTRTLEQTPIAELTALRERRRHGCLERAIVCHGGVGLSAQRVALGIRVRERSARARELAARSLHGGGARGQC